MYIYYIIYMYIYIYSYMLEHVSRLYYITLYYVTLQYYIILCYITLHYTILYYSILNYVCIYIYVGTCILISIWFVLHLKNLPNTLYPSRSCLLSFVFFLVRVLMLEDARRCSCWMQHFFCQIVQFPSTKLDDDYAYGWTTERVVVTILNCLTNWGGVGY